MRTKTKKVLRHWANHDDVPEWRDSVEDMVDEIEEYLEYGDSFNIIGQPFREALAIAREIEDQINRDFIE